MHWCRSANSKYIVCHNGFAPATNPLQQYIYQSILPSIKEVALQSMKTACEESVVQNEDSTDIAVNIIDGTWQNIHT